MEHSSTILLCLFHCKRQKVADTLQLQQQRQLQKSATTPAAAATKKSIRRPTTSAAAKSAAASATQQQLLKQQQLQASFRQNCWVSGMWKIQFLCESKRNNKFDELVNAEI